MGGDDGLEPDPADADERDERDAWATRSVRSRSPEMRLTSGRFTSRLVSDASTAPLPATAGLRLPLAASEPAEATADALDTKPPAMLTA